MYVFSSYVKPNGSDTLAIGVCVYLVFSSYVKPNGSDTATLSTFRAL